MDFDSNVVMVTGANSGIGRCSAMAFAKAGAKLILVARREKEGKKVEAEIEALGGEALFVKADVSIGNEVEEAVKTGIERFGKLDFAFNNAGAAETPCSTRDLSEEEWDRVMSINLKGTWLCMKNQLPHIMKNRGAVVNMASIYGLVATPMGLPAYVASKHGIVGLTKAAALEMAQSGVRINAICPGWIPTPGNEEALKQPGIQEYAETLHPMGRLGTQEEIANAVLWLCSKESSFITGQAIAADGGYIAQ